MAGSLILDSRGSPMQAASSPVPYMIDSVSSAIQQAGGGMAFQNNAVHRLFGPHLAFAAYLGSGMLQKVIEIPAADRTREWRDWQAEQDDIEKLEAEERRLGLIGKIKQAEILRGIGGGALILAMPGDTATPARPGDTIAAINVVSRWQLQLVDLDTNLASPRYGQPRLFRMTGETTGQQDIDPSRVICFTGDPIPAGFATASEDHFWGQSRLSRIVRDVQRSDHAAEWFAALVKKAKLLRIAIPGLTDFTGTDAGQAKLDRRMSAIAMGENILNATVIDAGDGKDGSGEKITDFQMTWNGIPAVQDMFDQRVAAVADIPFTRLMGRSPAGMNSTGQHDTDNWNKAVAAGQKLELRPCLDQLDVYLIPSAGVAANRTDRKTGKKVAVTWKFAPLDTPSEQEEAATFKTTMEAMTLLRDSNTIPEVAFNKGAQNLMSEREWVPGLDQALAEIPEAQRFGISQTPPDRDDDDSDPSSIQSGGGDPSVSAEGGEPLEATTRRRAANDKVSDPDA